MKKDAASTQYLAAARKLVAAVMADDLATVDELLIAGVNPNMGINGIPLLSYAALFDTDYTVIGHLIAGGADPLRRSADRRDIDVKLPGDLCADVFTREIFRAAEEQMVDKIFTDPDYRQNPFDDFSGDDISYKFMIVDNIRQNSWDIAKHPFMPSFGIDADNQPKQLPHFPAN